MKMQWKQLVIAFEITLGFGILAGLLSMDSVPTYDILIRPSFAPPPWVFMIVWPILYILLGISLYLVRISESEYKDTALKIFYVQLVLNFIWPLVFFNLHLIWAAFVIIMLLWVSIILMIRWFFKVNPLAGKLQIPYLLWVTFAAVLNLSIAILN